MVSAACRPARSQQPLPTHARRLDRPLTLTCAHAVDQHEGLAEQLAVLQKERDKRENQAQHTKNLRTDYINRIYEAEKAQVEDEFQVRPAVSLHAVSLLFGPR